MPSGTLQRLTAFTTSPAGGNPAGVWIGAELPADRTMQQIARDVGFSETAFVAPVSGFERVIRYFSPKAEVPFCGHATIAAGIALANGNGEGTYQLDTAVGRVPVVVRSIGGQLEASLTSVEPCHEPAAEPLLADVLSCLGWTLAELDDALPPARAFAGAWHLILAAASQRRLNDLNYDFEGLKTTMLREQLTTIQLIWQESPHVFHARNPFPVGGIVEDPATGAAAAALGGYLRDALRIPVPASIKVHQGEAMGRPALIKVTIPPEGGIVVSGNAVPL
jgi:PhzF family phenazine biosynthesis protein